MSGHVFTDDEIKQIIDVINTTKHTQYIGQRYVPVFGRKGEDTIEWDNSAPYEPLTIVLHAGNSYTSRQHVPTGADIDDRRYWANTGDYNAQIEQYRQAVATLRVQVQANTDNLGAMGVTDAGSAAALRTKVRTHDESLTALGAQTAAQAEALRAKIDGNSRKIEQTADKVQETQSTLGAMGVHNAGDASHLRSIVDYNKARLDGLGINDAGEASQFVQAVADMHVKVENTATRLDNLDALTRPLTSWAARGHPANGESASISTASPNTRMPYPEEVKNNPRYVSYDERNKEFTLKRGDYLITVRGRINSPVFSDSTNRALRYQFVNVSTGRDILFDDCKVYGANQEYNSVGILRVQSESLTVAAAIAYYTFPSGVTCNFRIEEASIAFILLQDTDYDATRPGAHMSSMLMAARDDEGEADAAADIEPVYIRLM